MASPTMPTDMAEHVTDAFVQNSIQPLFTEIDDSDDSDTPITKLMTYKWPQVNELESDSPSLFVPSDLLLQQDPRTGTTDNKQWLTEIESDELTDYCEAKGECTKTLQFTEMESTDENTDFTLRFSSNDSDYCEAKCERTKTLQFTEMESTDENTDFTLHFSSNDSDKENTRGNTPQNLVKTSCASKRKRKVRFEDAVFDTDESEDADDYETIVKKRKSRIPGICSVLRMRCCRLDCVSQVDAETAACARSTFCNRTGLDQRHWLLGYLSDHYKQRNDHFQYAYLIGTTKVCSTAWRNVHGITKTRFYQLKKCFEGGSRKFPTPGFLRKGEVSSKTVRSMAWLENYASRCGDKLPDSSRIHLPSCLTKGDVFKTMMTELEDVGEEGCKESVFYRHWRKQLGLIAIPKENRFAKCDKCTLLRTSIGKTLDKEKRKQLYAQRDKHLQLQNNERRKYYRHVLKAKTSPQLYMSIIVDGMDQKSTSLPKFLIEPKSMSSMWKLPTHITGVIVHGRGHHVYLDAKELPHDSNLTVNVILQTLQKYPLLPPTLYLQLDNCGRENKNKFVFALCCLLIELRIFKKIKVSFLMVGHTHEDIDQMFSRFSTYLWRHNVHTLSRLMKALPEAFLKPNVTVERLTNTVNFRDWVKPVLNNITEHSRPHVFRFALDEKGRAVMCTKGWGSTPDKWLPCACSNDDVPPYLLLRHPDGQPDAVKLDFSPLKLDKLQRDILKASRFFEDHEKKEWQELIGQLAEESRMEPVGYFPIADILATTIAAESSTTTSTVNRLEVLSDDDLRNPQVWFQNRRAKWRKKENTKKGPGRPAHNAQLVTCSGDPIPPDEIERRERLRLERKKQKQREKAEKNLAKVKKQCGSEPGGKPDQEGSVSGDDDDEESLGGMTKTDGPGEDRVDGCQLPLLSPGLNKQQISGDVLINEKKLKPTVGKPTKSEKTRREGKQGRSKLPHHCGADPANSAFRSSFSIDCLLSPRPTDVAGRGLQGLLAGHYAAAASLAATSPYAAAAAAAGFSPLAWGPLSAALAAGVPQPLGFLVERLLPPKPHGFPFLHHQHSHPQGAFEEQKTLSVERLRKKAEEHKNKVAVCKDSCSDTESTKMELSS